VLCWIANSRFTLLYISFAGPQMKLVNGQIVLDEESLVVQHSDLHGERAPMERVEESQHMRHITSATFGKRNRTVKWTEEDTIKFYEVSVYIF
jgi:transcription factor TFIIIB component B''